MADDGLNWADTSIRWLRTHHSGLAGPSVSRRSFTELLDMALWRMDYLRHERCDVGGWDKPTWRESLKEIAQEWNNADHVAMQKFLASGGYPALRAIAAVEEAEAITVAPLEPFVITNPDGSTEEFSIEMPTAFPLSGEAELEELMAAAERNADPRVGSW